MQCIKFCVMSAAEKLDKIGLGFMQNRCYE